MKIRLGKDEWYPVFGPSEYGEEVDVPESTVERWKQAEETFRAAQAEMMEALKNRTERRCKRCGELIRHDGESWQHVYAKGHPAEPPDS